MTGEGQGRENVAGFKAEIPFPMWRNERKRSIGHKTRANTGNEENTLIQIGD